MSVLISRIQQKKLKNIEKCGFYKGKKKNSDRPFRYLGSLVLMKNRKGEGLSISTMLLIKNEYSCFISTVATSYIIKLAIESKHTYSLQSGTSRVQKAA